MEIILKEDVQHLGFKDEIVNVKAGYGRNFLIPNRSAILATATEKKVLEEILKQRSVKDQKVKDAAEKTLEALKASPVQISAKAGEKGKIFGSINTIQLSDAIKALGHEVDRKSIKILGTQIKTLGKYEAELKLHREIFGNIEFEVVEEK